MQPIKPNYAPNTVNQTVEYGGVTWKGQPGGDWVQQSGGGTSGASTAAYDSLLTKIPKVQDYANTLTQNENADFGNYLNYMKSQNTPLQTYKQLSDEQGLPALRKTAATVQQGIYDLEDTLRKIPQNVDETTRESIVTQGQRAGMIEARSQPIRENLGWQGQSLGRIQSAISEGNQQALQLTGLEQQGIERMAGVYKDKLNLAVQQGTRALQSFTQDINTQLEVSLAKIARGEQLSDLEAAHAFELLKISKESEQRMKELEYQTNNGGGGGNRYITLSDGATLFDTQTGQIVSENTKNFKGNTTGGGDWS